MIRHADLPPEQELTELERLAAGAAILAAGLAYQHSDENLEAANEIGGRIAVLIRLAHAARLKAEEMRAGRHMIKQSGHIAGQLP